MSVSGNTAVNKTCPYCQGKIKSTSDFIICSECGTPHHKECWMENAGCTTYGCKYNTHSRSPEDENNITAVSFIECPKCKSQIEEASVYCSICGYKIKKEPAELEAERSKNDFEKEYRKRYEQTIRTRRRQLWTTLAGFFVIIVFTAFCIYFTYIKLHNYYNSPEYKVKSTVESWISSWEEKNYEKFRSYLTDDYEYQNKDGKINNIDQRLKQIKDSFQKNNNIKIKMSDFKIYRDSTSDINDTKISFKQDYTYDKNKESGYKILRLIRNPANAPEYKIYWEHYVDHL